MKFIENFKKRKASPLPFVHLPHHYAIKKTQERWFFSFLILLAFSIWYTYQYSQFKVEQNALVSAIVMKQDLSAPIKITAEHLVSIKFSKKLLPENFFEKTEDLVGKTLVHNVVKNQIVLPHDIHFESDPDSISAQFEDLFAFSIDESWLSSRLPEIRKNDKIDVVVSNPKNIKDQSATVAKQVKVLDVQEGKDKKKTLIVNITKEEAQAILFSQGLRLPMQILVYSSIAPNEPLAETVAEPLN